MNIYDTKVIVCIVCKKAIGEIEFDSTMLNPLCGQCSSFEEKIHATVKFYQDDSRIKIGQAV